MSARRPIRPRILLVSLVVLGTSAALTVQAQEALEPIEPQPQAVDLSGLTTVSRAIDENYPIGEASEIVVTNAYGDIRVTSWDSPVVRISGTTTVGAADPQAAQAFLDATTLDVKHTGNRIEIQPIYPPSDTANHIGFETYLEILVPDDASVSLSNLFADTFTKNIGGRLNVESRYGVVDIDGVRGIVRVRSKGEFPVRAQRLRQGGVFDLRSAQAYFSDVSGTLDVKNYFGPVEIHRPGDFIDLNVNAESGPIKLFLSANTHPDIEALATFGNVESEIPLDITMLGDSKFARSTNVDATQRIELRASFESISIHSEIAETPTDEIGLAHVPPIQAPVVSGPFPWREGLILVIEGAVGDVLVEGADGGEIVFDAVKRVRLESPDNAPAVLDGMTLTVQEVGDELRAVTTFVEGFETLGCTDYRVDMRIRVPKNTPIRAYGREGGVTLRDLAANVTVEQGQGSIVVERAAGSLDLSIDSGDVEVADCSGPVAVSGGGGEVTLRRLAGSAEVRYGGKTVVDSPMGALTVRNNGGDVRIIALEGIHGDYDILTEDGHISIVVPPTADASFWINARGGEVYSAIPVTGSMERDLQTFQGRLNEGKHRVLLETRRGNIILN